MSDFIRYFTRDTNMLWKCRVSVLTRDLCHISLCGVSDMVTQALSHLIIYFVFGLVSVCNAP